MELWGFKEIKDTGQAEKSLALIGLQEFTVTTVKSCVRLWYCGFCSKNTGLESRNSGLSSGSINKRLPDGGQMT